MKHLVVIAEKEELKLVEELGYDKYPVIITGVGGLNVIESLRDIPRDTQIINIGYAGSKDLKPGRFYCVDLSKSYHPNVIYNEPEYKMVYVPWGTKGCENFEIKNCLTFCDFVLESDTKDCLFDMELAYINALGFESVISFKYVSDNLDLYEYRTKLNED